MKKSFLIEPIKGDINRSIFYFYTFYKSAADKKVRPFSQFNKSLVYSFEAMVWIKCEIYLNQRVCFYKMYLYWNE